MLQKRKKLQNGMGFLGKGIASKALMEYKNKIATTKFCSGYFYALSAALSLTWHPCHAMFGAVQKYVCKIT